MEKHAEPFRSEQVLFQALHHASPVIFTSGFKREKSTGLSSKEYSFSTATKSTLRFFPHLRQWRLHTCFSLYGQAPSFLVCFTIFPVTLRTPGSYSNIRSQIRPFKFTAHMLQLTLLRDPNRTTPKKHVCILHFICIFPFPALNTSTHTAIKAKHRGNSRFGSLIPQLYRNLKSLSQNTISYHADYHFSGGEAKWHMHI